jgi:hypothetical protein
MLVLEVCPHCNLPLEASVADWAVERKGLGVCGEMLGKVVLTEEPLLTDSTLVRFHSSMPHLVPRIFSQN